MGQFLSKESKTKIKVLAWYQIIGGIMGILLTIWLISRMQQINGLVLLIVLLATALYVFSIYCGRLLITNKFDIGLKLSMINQFIQIPQFAMLGYAFWYVSGLMLTIGIKLSDGFTFTFDFGLFSTYQISVNTDETMFKIAINLVAIYMFYFISKLRSTVAEEKANYEELELPERSDDERMAYEI